MLKMPTRSGKPFKELRTKKAKNKDIAFDTNTTIETDTENNINVSNTSSNRDIITKKHKVKRSLEKATESNWIVSDLTNNVKQKHSQVNTTVDNGDFEPPPETEFTTSTRKLRSRKISVTDIMTKIKRNKGISTDAVASASTNNLEINTNSYNICENDCLKGDTELDSANPIDKKLKKKKNKKKKNHITKASPKKLDIPLNTTFEKVRENGDLCILSSDTKLYTARHNKDSPIKQIENRPSIEKDNTFEIKRERTPRHSENDNRSFNIKHDLKEDFNGSSSECTINVSLKKTSGINISRIEQQNDINNTTYDKDQNASTIVVHTTADSNQNNITSPTRCLRSRKSDTKNNFETSEEVIVNKKDEKSQRDCVNVTASITRKLSKNLKVEDLLSNTSPKSRKRKISNVKDDQGCKSVDTTYDLDKSLDKVNTSDRQINENLNTSNITNNQIPDQLSNTEMNTTNEKEDGNPVTSTTFQNNTTFDKERCYNIFREGAMVRKSSIKDNTSGNYITPNENTQIENILSSSASKRKSFRRRTLNINDSYSIKLDSTFDSKPSTNSELKREKLSLAYEQILNTTFDKDNERDSKSSLISSDNSVSNQYDLTQISITSDDTDEHITNTTPVLVESIIRESSHTEDLTNSSFRRNSDVVIIENPETPMKREGTFTKDGPEVQVQTPKPTTRLSSSVLPTPGCTPYHISKTSQKKSMLNVTRSIEKKMSGEPAPRMTRVMFCSPVDNPTLLEQEKRKIIKSNLKGSNKSFVFDEDAVTSRPARKRSYTHNDVDNMSAKRSRLMDDLQNSVNRLSRPRTTSATGALSTPKKLTTPSKSKSASKSVRTRLPNFGALHQKEFAKMESLDEYHDRKVKRARQILTTPGSTGMPERGTPKKNTEVQKSATKDSKKPIEKTDTPLKKLPTLESLRPGYTKFGFKLNLNINPFSIPPKTEKLQEKPTEMPRRPLPSLTGTTAVKKGLGATRRDAAKNAIMREKSNLEKRTMNRSENRTIIKGVRTNRRFELQMKLRNIN